MHRNSTLLDLAPAEVLRVSEKQLGVFFCVETFVFVLPPHTRRAANRVARWHGCTFQFNETNGTASFTKLDRASALIVRVPEVDRPVMPASAVAGEARPSSPVPRSTPERHAVSSGEVNQAAFPRGQRRRAVGRQQQAPRTAVTNTRAVARPVRADWTGR